MGSKGGGGGGSGSNSFGFSSGTSTYTPNPQAMAAFQQSLGMANNAVSRPYEPYQGQMAAGFTPDQMAAMQGVRNTQGIAQPYINTATNLTGQAVDYSNPANFNQYSLNQYMNPYQQSVVDATMKQLAQTQAQAMQQSQSQAANRGTFGGSGQYLGQAEVARQQGLANAQTLAQLNASNYQQAQNQYNQQQQQAIQTAQNAAYGLGQLGNMAQSSALTGINALLQSGGMQQQLAQQQLTGAYNQWLQEKAYPYQQAAFYSGIASGIGPSMGGTTTYSGINMGQQQQSGGGGGGGGGGMGGIGSIMSMLPAMFSDENEKTDKKKLGKDPETGLDMYAYRYKGDPKSYPKVVGPMAQDVEEKYPGFVYDIGGKKVVSDGERFMPREGRASGGSSSGAGSSAQSSSSPTSNAPTDVYAAPQVNYQSSSPVPGSAQASASEAMDPGTAQFLKGFLDPQTANEIARAKWVSKNTETRTAPEDSFGYFSQLAGYADGGRVEYARGGGNAGGPWGELPAQVIQSPLSGLGQVGQLPLGTGKDTPGSLGDMNKGTKLMFGANPIDSSQGSFAIAGVPSASMAPSNLPAEAAKIAKAATPPKAASTEHFSKQGAEMAKSGAASAAKSGGGGGSSGGGGGGMPKMPSMKGVGSKGAIDKQASGNASSIPAENTPKEATESPAEQKQEAQPTPESQDAKIVEPNEVAAQDAAAAEAAAPEAGGGEGFGGMEGGMEAAAPEMAAPEAAAPEMGGGDMGGGMGGLQDIFSGFGGFFADGGRVHKSGGGAGGAGAGGFGEMGDGPVDIAPSGLAEAAGVGPSSLLGKPNAGLGQLTTGFGNKPSGLAGFDKLKAGQERRTGSDLTKGWMQQYRDEYTGGPQKTPKEQGMPEMPDAEWYKTPLNVSDLSIGSNGTPNPGGISYTPIMTGMKGSGMGLFPTFNPPTNGSDYNDTSKMFKAPPVSKYKGDQPVHGYYTNLASQQVNPDTGLFNVNYLAPYYGGFYKDGGRVGMKEGGTPKLSTMDLVKILMKQGATPQEAVMLSSIAHPESGMNPYAHNPNARTGDNSYGLFQINMLGGMGPERLKKFGLKSANDLYDPNTNARVALQMLRERGSPKDWTTWKSGKNQPFLSQSKEAVAQYLNDPNIRNSPVNFEFNKDLPAMAQKGAYGYIAPSPSVSSSGSGQLPLSQDNEQHGFLMDILNGIFGEKGLLGELFGPEQASAAPAAPTGATSAVTPRKEQALSRAEPAAAEPASVGDELVYRAPAQTAPTGSNLGRINPDDPSGPLKPVETTETQSPGFAPMVAEPGSRADALNKVMSGAANVDRRAEAEEVPQTFASLEAPPSDSNTMPDEGDQQAARRGGRMRKKYATDGEVKKEKSDDKETVSQSGEVKYDIPAAVLPSSRQAAQTSQEGFGGLFGDQGGQDFYTRWKTNPLSQFIYHLGQAAEGHHNGNIGQALLAGLPHAVQGTMGALQAQRAMAEEEAKRQHSMDFALGVNKAINEAMTERARGGMVRHGYATDGAVEPEGDFLGDLGSMFGGEEPAAAPQRSAASEARTAPVEDQGGLFDGLFGGAEEPVAAQRQPRAAAAPQQEKGFLEDVFGWPEEQAAPQRAPRAEAAQQEPGFLEEIFGPEEAPRAAPSQKAPVVATDMPTRGDAPKAQPSVAPTEAQPASPAPADTPNAAPLGPVSKTEPTPAPKTEAPATTTQAGYTGPIYEHPQMRAYDRAIRETMQIAPQTKEDVAYLNSRLSMLRNEKKDFATQLQNERTYQLQAQKAKPETSEEKKQRAIDVANAAEMNREQRDSVKKGLVYSENQGKAVVSARNLQHTVGEVEKALNRIESGSYTPAMVEGYRLLHPSLRTQAMEQAIEDMETIGKLNPEVVKNYTSGFSGGVRVAELNLGKQGAPDASKSPGANRNILANLKASSQLQLDYNKDLQAFREGKRRTEEELRKFEDDWMNKKEHQFERYFDDAYKSTKIKGVREDKKAQSAPKSEGVKSEGAPTYSGPVIVNQATGQRMRLSDDGKSWVGM